MPEWHIFYDCPVPYMVQDNFCISQYTIFIVYCENSYVPFMARNYKTTTKWGYYKIDCFNFKYNIPEYYAENLCKSTRFCYNITMNKFRRRKNG